jgi:hypothetical protein
LVRTEDVTENEVEVSRRCHDARQQQPAELMRLSALLLTESISRYGKP